MGFSADKYSNQRQELIPMIEKASSLEELRENVQNHKMNPGIKDSIMRSLNSLIHVSAFSEEPEGNVIQDLRDGYAVVLNMRGYDRINVGPATLPQIYLSIVQRLVVESREAAREGNGPIDGRLHRKVVFFIDEAPKFLELGTLTYKSLMDSVDVHRQIGVSMVFAAQTIERVPDALLKQCRYKFMPFNIDLNTAWELGKLDQFYEWRPEKKKEIAEWLGSMRRLSDGRREWVMMDNEMKSREKFFCYPPLSAHTEE